MENFMQRSLIATLIAAGALVYSGPAFADSKLGILTNIQLNGWVDGVTLGSNDSAPDPSDPMASEFGERNDAADILFIPSICNGFVNPSSNNLIADDEGCVTTQLLVPTTGSSIDAEIGEVSQVLAATGTGIFTGIPLFSSGNIRNFDLYNLYSGTTPTDATLAFKGVYEGTDALFYFGLTEFNVTSVSDDFGGTNTTGSYDFDGKGIVSIYQDITGTFLHEAEFTLDANATGIFNNGTGGDPTAGDRITSVGNADITLIVKDVPPPEVVDEGPTSLALLGVTAAAFTYKPKRKKQG